MIQYLFEMLIFQLVFLSVYDLLLKKETFFQWNRAYLLMTFVLSLLLPLTKIEALKTTVSTHAIPYQGFWIQLNEVVMDSQVKPSQFSDSPNMFLVVYLIGAILMTVWFIVKLSQLVNLMAKGNIESYPNFIKIVVPNSKIAFSFFKLVFVGDGIPREKESQILNHEAVHIRQWHSLDLLFFELTRIVFWYNPLVYIYQHRLSDLHEFIADSHGDKSSKNEKCQLLLSEAFQTQNLSFVNQFFKKSLIKKRVVMLTKERSKAIFKLKYLTLAPLLLLMLMFSSCELKNDGSRTQLEANTALESEIPFSTIDEVPIFPGCEDVEDKKTCFQEKMISHIQKHFNYPEEAEREGIQGKVSAIFIISSDGEIANIRTEGPDPILEKEVSRIIGRLPKMQPGKHNGQSVKVPFSIPITFKLD